MVSDSNLSSQDQEGEKDVFSCHFYSVLSVKFESEQLSRKINKKHLNWKGKSKTISICRFIQRNSK